MAIFVSKTWTLSYGSVYTNCPMWPHMLGKTFQNSRILDYDFSDGTVDRNLSANATVCGFDSCLGEIPPAKEHLGLCAAVTKPVCCSFWSLCTQGLSFATRDATAARSPCEVMASSPCLLLLEKSTQLWRPSKAKGKKKILDCDGWVGLR